MLSDIGIVQAVEDRRLTISPWRPRNLQPCSYDVTLGADLLIYPGGNEPLDCAVTAEMIPLDGEEDGSVVLRPGEFALAATVEFVSLAHDLAGRIEGKSSLARRGLGIHTAGFVDAGFAGQLTLELTNLTWRSLRLYPGMAIGQLAFFDLDQPARYPYGPARGSHYQHQSGPTPSAVHRQIAEGLGPSRWAQGGVDESRASIAGSSSTHGEPSAGHE